jgi:putative transposase
VTADVFRLADETQTSAAAVCRALELPRSTVYARRSRSASNRAKQTASLDVEVTAIHAESHKRYGSPRVHQELLRRGRRVGRKRVAKRMQKLDLHARRPKRFRRTTQSDASHVPAANVLDRRFDWAAPNQAWAGDITFVWTLAGWVYLAILVDLCTRAIVGWGLSTRCDAQLALQALNRATARHRPGPGLIHHTDRGSTYTAQDYQKRVRELGMVPSMSRRANCWDNAVAESTFATIKAELFGERIPVDIHDARCALFPYIEGFYNRRRLHSAIGYLTPTEKEIITSHAKQVA